MQHNYFVYILECADSSYYVAVTNDLETRLEQHQNGHDKKAYTFKRRPVVLRYSEWFSDVQQAIAREKQFKGWTPIKKEALMAGDDKLLSFHALGYERRTFPPLTKDQRS